jgi:hypothetical protein
MNPGGEAFRPWRRRRIDHERFQTSLFVNEKQIGVVVRHDAADVRRDRRPQPCQVTLGDDRVGYFEQRSPVVPFRLEIVGAGLG